jgi:hypothetical protein
VLIKGSHSKAEKMNLQAQIWGDLTRRVENLPLPGSDAKIYPVKVRQRAAARFFYMMQRCSAELMGREMVD